MLSQNNIILDKLVLLNKNISHIIMLNLVGDIISQYHRNVTVPNKYTEKVSESFSRIVTTASLLNFDNVKFLMYEEGNLKNIIINFREISIVIGLENDASISDVLDILSEFVKTIRLLEIQ
jgi:hypothetical protein